MSDEWYKSMDDITHLPDLFWTHICYIALDTASTATERYKKYPSNNNADDLWRKRARKSQIQPRLTSIILHIIDIYYHTALFIYVQSYLGSIFWSCPHKNFGRKQNECQIYGWADVCQCEIYIVKIWFNFECFPFEIRSLWWAAVSYMDNEICLRIKY